VALLSSCFVNTSHIHPFARGPFSRFFYFCTLFLLALFFRFHCQSVIKSLPVGLSPRACGRRLSKTSGWSMISIFSHFVPLGVSLFSMRRPDSPTNWAASHGLQHRLFSLLSHGHPLKIFFFAIVGTHRPTASPQTNRNQTRFLPPNINVVWLSFALAGPRRLNFSEPPLFPAFPLFQCMIAGLPVVT